MLLGLDLLDMLEGLVVLLGSKESDIFLRHKMIWLVSMLFFIPYALVGMSVVDDSWALCR